MERERYSDEDDAERETDSNEASDRERGMAVFGETDIDPNREDQRSAHQADESEHL
jgi:hypothetical protein